MSGNHHSILAFYHLLRCGLWGTSVAMPAYFPMSRSHWQDVYNMARQQTVRGIVFQGICLLPHKHMPPDDELVRWAACADEIERHNRHINHVLIHLSSHFRSSGLRPVVLKGQGIASMYTEPLLRECGDIDLYFPSNDERRLAENLVSQAGIPIQHHADGSSSYRYHGIVIEHHSCLCDLHGTSVQRFVHSMETKYGFQEISLISGNQSASILIPSPHLNWVLLNSHILKHTLGRGIGLRQLCDFARFCSCNSFHTGADDLHTVCRLSGISRWTHLLQSSLVDYLGLPTTSLPISMGATDASRLMDMIMGGGNFGQHASGRDLCHHTWKRKMQTAFSFLRNVDFSIRYAPRQAMYTFAQLLKGQIFNK